MFASERVRLRPMVPDDATVLYEMWSDPEHHMITDDSPMLIESLAARRPRCSRQRARIQREQAGANPIVPLSAGSPDRVPLPERQCAGQLLLALREAVTLPVGLQTERGG
jgi:hypothetical protein